MLHPQLVQQPLRSSGPSVHLGPSPSWDLLLPQVPPCSTLVTELQANMHHCLLTPTGQQGKGSQGPIFPGRGRSDCRADCTQAA